MEDKIVLSDTLLDSLFDGVYTCDKDRKILFWNKGAERITGFRGDEVVGHHCHDNLLRHVDTQGQSLCHGGCPLAHTIEDGQFRETKVFLHHRDGHRVPVSVRVSPVMDKNGAVTGAVEVFSDHTSQIDLEERIQELERLAMLDALTGLPNRRFMEESIHSKLAELSRLGWHFGVLFIDIDHFKNVNDTHGHDVGDEVLRVVGKTVQHNSRPYDVFGRWGGEEFLVVVPNVDGEALIRVAERYRMLIKTSSIARNNQPISVTVSLGATLAVSEDTVESLLQRVDSNLYKSKQEGRDLTTYA